MYLPCESPCGCYKYPVFPPGERALCLLVSHRRREVWRLERCVSSTCRWNGHIPSSAKTSACRSQLVTAAQPGGARSQQGRGRLCLKLLGCASCPITNAQLQDEGASELGQQRRELSCSTSERLAEVWGVKKDETDSALD